MYRTAQKVSSSVFITSDILKYWRSKNPAKRFRCRRSNFMACATRRWSVSSIKNLNLCAGSSVRGIESIVPLNQMSCSVIITSEILKYTRSNTCKKESLQAIAFDGICIKALSLEGAWAPSDADDAGKHRQDRDLVRGLRYNKRYTWNVMTWCQGC